MSRVDDKKFHSYSLSFYQKEKQLIDLNNRIKMGFGNFQKHDKILKPRSISSFMAFINENRPRQQEQLQQDAEAVIDALLDILKGLRTDVDLTELVLTTLDAVLTEDKRILEQLTTDVVQNKYPFLMDLLKSIQLVDDYKDTTYSSAARIRAMILGELPREKGQSESKAFLLELSQNKKQGRSRLSDFSIVSCLSFLIKHDYLCLFFIENNCTGIVSDALTHSGNDVQLIYYSLMAVWLLSFSKEAIDNYIGVGRLRVIKHICEILQRVSRQKVTRMAFMIFKNLAGYMSCLELMIDNKLLRMIEALLKGSIKDQELIEQIKSIGVTLQNSIKDLSSYEKYSREIASEYLEWSSVHTERFWRENAIKFENSDFVMIRKLKTLLNSLNQVNVAIACYDLGEFARFYPRGKAQETMEGLYGNNNYFPYTISLPLLSTEQHNQTFSVLESLNIKEIIMEKAKNSDDKNVRQQALNTLQSIMIQNWQEI